MKQIVLITLAAFIFPWMIQGQTIVPLGPLGEEGELFDPLQVKEGPEGQIYIYDRADGFFKVFSSECRFLFQFGGEGQGPGEIQRREAVSFGFTPDNKFYFSEYFQGHPWISMTELNGRFVKAIKPDIKEFFGILRAEFLPDGRILAEFHYIGKPEREKDHFYHRSPKEVVLLESDGGHHPPIVKANHITRISYESRGADSPIPFTPGFFWAPLGEGEMVFSDGLNTHLKVFDHSGKLIREIPTSLPDPKPVTSRDLKEWRDFRKEMMSSRNPEWWNRFGRVVEDYKKSIHDRHPNLSGLSVSPEGNILISGAGNNDEKKLKHWLLDRKGHLLAGIETDARGLSITPHYIFCRIVDDDRVTTVFAFKRTAAEPEDFRAFAKTIDEMN